MPEGLKLVAANTDDLEILSAALEGTITSPGEMSFLRSRRAFTLMGSRFKWEDVTDEVDQHGAWFRIRSGVYVSDVLAVQSSGISQSTPTEVLELLNISVEMKDDIAADICLEFAGGGTIKLDVECINVTLTDVDKAWQTEQKPVHEDTSAPKDN
ncbi:MAG: DUF2948 family protein [Proteobacteria bacterium]|nr:DUF2948 family protein [Pseudomonadota bacterium]